MRWILFLISTILSIQKCIDSYFVFLAFHIHNNMQLFHMTVFHVLLLHSKPKALPFLLCICYLMFLNGCLVSCHNFEVDILGRLYLLGCIPMHVKQSYPAGRCKICKFRLVRMFCTISCSCYQGMLLHVRFP